jgi:hypothetical protein
MNNVITPQATEAQVIALNERIASLEAQLALARTCYRALRDSITAPVVFTAVATTAPTVTRYRDALGREWIKTRIGTRATSRLAEPELVAA